MDGHEISVAPLQISDDSINTASSTTRKLKKRFANFSLLSYSVGFVFAAILSLGLTAFCLWMIYLDFRTGATFSISGWCQSIITFLLGAWITDRPKFFKEKDKKK